MEMEEVEMKEESAKLFTETEKEKNVFWENMEMLKNKMEENMTSLKIRIKQQIQQIKNGSRGKFSFYMCKTKTNKYHIF